MKLEEFENLANAATPGPWGTDAHYVVGKVDEDIYVIIADTFSTQTGRERANADFIAACSVMVPRMIEALTAARHTLRALDSGQAVISCSALHKWLSDTFSKLEQP